MKKIVMIVGSLRKNSFNYQLANHIKNLLCSTAEVSFLEYADLPFMNQDVEFPPPESVARVRQVIQDSDGIWIISPEYNHHIPGVLKNLLDWLSRSLKQGDPQRISAVTGKAVTISSVAGKSAGSDVRKHLVSLLDTMSMNVVGGTGTGISLNADSFASDKLILSAKAQEELKVQVEQFLNV